MFRGLITGVMLGGVFAASFLAATSLLLPPPAGMPEPGAVTVPDPAPVAEPEPDRDAALEPEQAQEPEPDPTPAAEPETEAEPADAVADADAAPAVEVAPEQPPTEDEAPQRPAPAPLAPPAATTDAAPQVEMPRQDGAAPPTPEAGMVEVPPGSEFRRAGDDLQPVAPERAEPAPDLGTAQAVTAPAAEPAPDLPEMETAAAPDVAGEPTAPGAPAEAAPPPEAPEAETPVAAPNAAPQPEAPAEGAAPNLPDTAPPPVLAEEPAGSAAPPSVTDSLPSAEPAQPVAPTAEMALPAPGGDAADAGALPRRLPQIGAGDATEASPPEADPGSPPQVSDTAPTLPTIAEPGFGQAEGVRVNRLPQAGVEADTPAEPATDRNAEPDGALARHAAAFEAPEGADLLGLVLIALPEAEGGLDPAGIVALDLPVSVALDPLAPGAADRARALRAAGIEVGLLAASVPQGARPADLAVNFDAWQEAVPGAALIVEAPQLGFQNTRPLAQLVVGLAGDGGYGLITHDEGLNIADQLAAQSGVPRAESFRILDTARDTPAALRRVLDRAAFEATRSGQVLVAAAARAETVAVIRDWLEGTRRDLAPAPASAVLLGR